ncbi:hypothetical protein ACFWPV_19480 [Streptomyces uncialis]|uniref:hypothetical protein n=1 Tax=Streptomyces uncialis TaxID=1048205 RepID=UPI00364827B5
MKLTVDSWPAMSGRKAMESSSSSSSRSPFSSSVWISALSRSSPGAARFAATSPERCGTASAWAARAASALVGAATSSDHPRKASRSRSGMPSSSQTTVSRSGYASASTRSARRSGAASMASRSASVGRWTRGSGAATRGDRLSLRLRPR